MLGARDEAAEFDEMDSSTSAEMFNDDPRFVFSKHFHFCKAEESPKCFQDNVKPEAYNPEAYNFVAMLGFFKEPIKIYFLIWNYW